ncbi:MAG TPA: hypothetical protein VNW47_15860 [Terriglobales bacterium]|jgi:hypothetical protein|nr:hypothetical protein [Terriglobales bacterium]
MEHKSAEQASETGGGQSGEHSHHHRKEVAVTVDGKTHQVQEGAYVVSEFKKLVGVDPSKELDEVVHGELKPLDDTQKIHIKGGEVFISHARQGGSA